MEKEKVIFLASLLSATPCKLAFVTRRRQRRLEVKGNQGKLPDELKRNHTWRFVTKNDFHFTLPRSGIRRLSNINTMTLPKTKRSVGNRRKCSNRKPVFFIDLMKRGKKRDGLITSSSGAAPAARDKKSLRSIIE